MELEAPKAEKHGTENAKGGSGEGLSQSSIIFKTNMHKSKCFGAKEYNMAAKLPIFRPCRHLFHPLLVLFKN